MTATTTVSQSPSPTRLKRTAHWATREFHHFLLHRAKTPFKWGTNDCALFAADAIKSFTGVDLAAEFRGKYSDQPTALAAIHNITGGRTVADAAVWAAKKHGLEERTHPLMASRGDLVLVQNGDGNLIAGIVHLNGRHAVSIGEDGMKRFSIRAVKRAWEI
jgi:hypothetical protein